MNDLNVAFFSRSQSPPSPAPPPSPLLQPPPLRSHTQLVHARARRRFQRGLKRRPMGLIKKLRKAKKDAGHSKPEMVKTHLRDMIIVPEMIGSVVGVYVSLQCSVQCCGWRED